MTRALHSLIRPAWVVVPRLTHQNPSPSTWSAWAGITGPHTITRLSALRHAGRMSLQAAATGHSQVSFVARRLPFDPANAPLSATEGHDQ